MSGRHATIKVLNGLYVIEDHSTNGPGSTIDDSAHELVDNDFVNSARHHEVQGALKSTTEGLSMLGGRKLPNCGQPQEKHWDKCPFCINMTGSAFVAAAPPWRLPRRRGFGGQSGYSGYAAARPRATARRAAGIAPQAPWRSPLDRARRLWPQQLGWLVPLKGPHRGELHTLKQTSVIGKDPTCDVVFNDPLIRPARHHPRPAERFLLEDHSTNGTLSTTKSQDPRASRHDFIKLGQTLIKFKAL